MCSTLHWTLTIALLPIFSALGVFFFRVTTVELKETKYESQQLHRVEKATTNNHSLQTTNVYRQTSPAHSSTTQQTVFWTACNMVRLMERLCREYGEPEDHGGDD